jgi:hypothetical protein
MRGEAVVLAMVDEGPLDRHGAGKRLGVVLECNKESVARMVNLIAAVSPEERPKGVVVPP